MENFGRLEVVRTDFRISCWPSSRLVKGGRCEIVTGGIIAFSLVAITTRALLLPGGRKIYRSLHSSPRLDHCDAVIFPFKKTQMEILKG